MTFIKSKHLFITVGIILLLIAHGPRAQTPEDYLRSYLIDFYQSQDGQRAIVSRLEIPRDRQDIYLEYIRDLFSEVALLEDLARNLIYIIGDATPSDLERLTPIFAEVGFGIAVDAVGEGMQRLPPSETRILLAHDLANTQNLPPELCMAAIDNKLSASEQTSLGLSYQNQLSMPALREYLTLNRKAIHAHYTGSPNKRSLSPSQERIASDTFTQRLIEHPHSELLGEILTNPDRYSDAENCWAITEVGWIAINEPGIVGDWLIIWLMDSF